MDYNKRWHIIDGLGEGGQGKVYRVLDLHEVGGADPKLVFTELGKLIEQFTTSIYAKGYEELSESFRKALAEVKRMEDPGNYGALKELYDPQDTKAQARIKREIEAMNRISHPNLLKILDYDNEDFRWFVSQFHPNKTLSENKNRFTGDFVGSLRAFRPVVEGVSKLHKDDWVHRDIKPQNVFLDSDSNLVLGDFGLIFFADEQHTRLTETFEKVGTRDWMAPWAYRHGMKIEDVKPTFDVFSLGKLLWAMVSETPTLPYWYFEEPENNLENMFPNTPYINCANHLLKKCIVEKEEDCQNNASELLKEVEDLLAMIDRNADLIGEKIERHCKVCGIGSYQLVVDRDNIHKLADFGFSKVSGLSFKLFTCDHCGHIQLFNFGGRQIPPAWAD